MQHQTVLLIFLIVFSISSYAVTDCQKIEHTFARESCLQETSKTNSESENDIAALTLPIDQFNYLSEVKPFKFIPYEPVYLMPVAFTPQPNNEALINNSEVGQEKIEVKFQLSTRAKIANNLLHKNGDLWFGYTQKSFWQLYNDASSPFRETNYKPELWFSLSTDYKIFGLNNRLIDIGITHESNGRGLTLSRSWNRGFIRFGMESENLTLFIMPWSRIKIDSIDNNPDIETYVGRAEIKIIYQNDDRVLTGVIRNNFELDHNRGSYELSWIIPMTSNLRGIVQYFNGYGESLIDFNTRIQRLSIGLVILEW